MPYNEMHDYKCKNCNTIWQTRLSFDRGVAHCPNCGRMLYRMLYESKPKRGVTRHSVALGLPVADQHEAQNQSDNYRRFQDII